MKKYLITASFLTLLLPAGAQKIFSIEEAVTYGSGKLSPESLSGHSWIPGTNTHYHYARADKQSSLVFMEAGETGSDTLDLEKLNFALKQYNGIKRATGTPLPDFTSFPRIQNWKDEHSFRFIRERVVYVYDMRSEMLSVENGLEEGAENLEFFPELGHIAYTKGQNLYMKATGTLPVQITFDSTDGIVNGRAVHRNEFGIHKGIFWSPDAKKIAWYHMDESMVTSYPVYDLDAMPAGADFIRYPFAGARSHEVKLGVYDIRSSSVIYLQTGLPADQYLTNIAWDPKGKYIYVAIVNREQNSMSLKKFDAESGEELVTLITEKHDKYVEPEHPMEWVDKKHFIWQSERNGYNHLYLYDDDGILQRQLTDGKWVVTEFLGCDKKGKTAYFMATRQSPLNRNLYKVDLKSGEITELTAENGYHSCEGSSDKKYWIDHYSSASVPGISQIVREKDLNKTVLLKSKNPLQDYELGSDSVFTIRSTDGSTDLYCRMIKPSHFDPAKKYPVVVYVYGGPHLQLIRNSWMNGANLWMHYMAQQGYVVFSLDNRGSANRGLEFENATFRQLGTVELADQLAGVAFLKQQTFVDASRMAVHGWSFGGFMTTSLMTRFPNTFKVGVAGGPVIDWSMYEIMYTERYMDKPEENPEGYKQANLLNYVENLNGKLLLIHGTSDDVVLWQHSLLYVKKCVDKEVLLDYFVYPGHPHNVRGKDRVHLMRKVSEYIKDNLEN